MIFTARYIQRIIRHPASNEFPICVNADISDCYEGGNMLQSIIYAWYTVHEALTDRSAMLAAATQSM